MMRSKIFLAFFLTLLFAIGASALTINNFTNGETADAVALNTAMAQVETAVDALEDGVPLVTVADNESTSENNAVVFLPGGDLDGGNLALESDGTFNYNPGTGLVTATGFAGTTLITDNESTSETNAIVFTAGGDVDGGQVGLESDGDLTYDPATGLLSATGYSGTILITDNESTSETNAIVFTAGADIDGGQIGMESDGDLTYDPATGLLSTTGLATATVAATGNITGMMDIITTTDGSETVTMLGQMYHADHGTSTNDTTYTLPAVGDGLHGCFQDMSGGTGKVILDPEATDAIALNGLLAADNENILSPGGANDSGDSICLYSDGTNWFTINRLGTWVEASP